MGLNSLQPGDGAVNEENSQRGEDAVLQLGQAIRGQALAQLGQQFRHRTLAVDGRYQPSFRALRLSSRPIVQRCRPKARAISARLKPCLLSAESA